MGLFRKKEVKEVVINLKTGEVKDYNAKDYDTDKDNIIDVSKIVQTATGFQMKYMPPEATWREIGMTNEAKAVNEISKDYEQRKAEGFPPPLYPSEFETPEHFTPEYEALLIKNKYVQNIPGLCYNDKYIEIAEKYNLTYRPDVDHDDSFVGDTIVML